MFTRFLLTTLTEKDMSAIGNVITFPQPLKTARVTLCEESNRTLSNCIPLKHQLFWSIMKIKEDDLELLKQNRDRTVFLSFSKIWIHQTTTYLCHLTWSLKLLSLPSEKAKVLVFYELTDKYAIVKQEPTCGCDLARRPFNWNVSPSRRRQWTAKVKTQGA